jgi:hypothetical protein
MLASTLSKPYRSDAEKIGKTLWWPCGKTWCNLVVFMDTENEQFGQFLGVIDSNKINNK